MDDGATHFLIYLNEETWTEEAGDKLANEVRLARASGMPILLVHEMDEGSGAVAFDRFFHVTPEDLVKGGLYKILALQWFSGMHRAVRKRRFSEQ